MNKQIAVKIGIIALLVGAFVAAYPYLKEYLSLDYVKGELMEFREYYAENRLLVLSGYFFAYVLITALSLPGALLMTVLAGALFGFLVSVVMVSFASSIGATAAFLVARYLFGESIQKKYGDKLEKFNEGIEREGAFYLFAMRLIPLFPFFLVNILMALTKIPALTFYWVSQVGMLAGTAVYIHAGAEIAKIEKLKDIASPTLIAAFFAIGLLPLVAKKSIAFIRAKKTVKKQP